MYLQTETALQLQSGRVPDVVYSISFYQLVCFLRPACLHPKITKFFVSVATATNLSKQQLFVLEIVS